jgi:hypothetical protein
MVAWYSSASSQYIVWSTDGSGNYLSQTGAMLGSDASLKAFEPTFQQDLNNNGTIGTSIGELAGSSAAGYDTTAVSLVLLTNAMAAFAPTAATGLFAETSPASVEDVLTKPLA